MAGLNRNGRVDRNAAMTVLSRRPFATAGPQRIVNRTGVTTSLFDSTQAAPSAAQRIK